MLEVSLAVNCLICGQWVRQTSRVYQAGHCEVRAGHLSAEYDPGQGGSEAGDPVWYRRLPQPGAGGGRGHENQHHRLLKQGQGGEVSRDN